MRNVFSAIAWQARVVGHLAVSHPLATIPAIALGVIGHVAHVAAFLLPLKVILLAGSNGVPRYFKAIVGPDDKAAAIVIFSIGAAFCYILSLWLDTVVRRLGASGAGRVLRQSNSVAIVSNQDDETSNLVLQFIQLASGTLFGLIVLGVLAWLDPLVFACLLAGMVGGFLYLASAEDGVERISGRGTGNTLGIFASLTFFACFALILLPYVTPLPDGNLLLAIIAFVLVRQVLGMLPRMVRQSIRLSADRVLTSALIFREHQVERHETTSAQSFGEVFARPARVDRVRAGLLAAGAIGPEAEVDVRWIDPVGRETQSFEVWVEEPGWARRLYLLRVVQPGARLTAENEEFLFRSVPREALSSPPVVARFGEGRFDCRISEIGEGAVPRPVAPAVIDDLVEQCWSLEPGERLTADYRVSHQLLHERLNERLVARIRLAVDDEAEAGTLAAFLDALPQVCQTLATMPLYLFNPRLDPAHVWRDGTGAPVVQNWGRWSLEPLGAILPESEDPERLALRLERVRAARPSVTEAVTVDHLALANAAYRLERNIERSQFKRALQTMSEILASPLVTAADPVVNAEERRARRREQRRGARRGLLTGTPAAADG